MPVLVQRTFGSLADLKFSNREMMREIGLLAREMIVRRTMSGKDETGSPFQPYSAAYAARKAKELGGGSVNLTVSGSMLRNFQVVEVTESSVTLGWVT